RMHEAIEVRARAELGIEARVVHDVVAMQAAGTRGEDRRAIDVAHAELGQVRSERSRVVEGEARMKLEAIGRARDAQPRWLGRALAAYRAHSPRNALEARVRRPRFEGDRELAPPVGMLVDRPRKVRLLAHAEDVFHLDRG